MKKAAKAKGLLKMNQSHGRPPWAGMEAHFLFSDELTPVCSPELLSGSVPLRAPADLVGHTLLHVNREIEEWPEWLRAAGAGQVTSPHNLKFDSSRMALDVALAGLGVALGRFPFVADDLRSGRLVAPFDTRIRSKSAYYLTCPQAATENAKVKVFCDWVLQGVADYPAGAAAIDAASHPTTLC